MSHCRRQRQRFSVAAGNKPTATVRDLPYLDICWCSPLDMGFIPSPLLLFVEQPLANAKTTASPKQRLILVRRLCFVFITGFSFIDLFFSVPANDVFANLFLAMDRG